MNEILYLVQYAHNGETHIHWPADEVQYEKAVAHLRLSGCEDYSIGRTHLTVLEDGSVRWEWQNVERRGIYQERPHQCSNTSEA